MSSNIVEKKTWKEFRKTGLLWFINSILHVFGWAIVLERDSETKEITDCYPARVKFRGFSEDRNTEGYQQLSVYMLDNADKLFKEAIGDDEDDDNEAQISPDKSLKQEVCTPNFSIHKGADDSWDKDLPEPPDIEMREEKYGV